MSRYRKIFANGIGHILIMGSDTTVRFPMRENRQKLNKHRKISVEHNFLINPMYNIYTRMTLGFIFLSGLLHFSMTIH